MHLNNSFILFNYIVENIAKDLSRIENISEEEALRRVEKILENRLEKRSAQ